jgi:hypothetical protein
MGVSSEPSFQTPKTFYSHLLSPSRHPFIILGILSLMHCVTYTSKDYFKQLSDFESTLSVIVHQETINTYLGRIRRCFLFGNTFVYPSATSSS